ncbi:MAG: hypothetical protein ACREUR_08475, partial [Nitrosospira sp.]
SMPSKVMNLPLAAFETVIYLKNTGSGISRLLERKLRCAVYLILASDTICLYPTFGRMGEAKCNPSSGLLPIRPDTIWTRNNTGLMRCQRAGNWRCMVHPI